MDFDSPDVEKDFPGLYTPVDKTKKAKDESDYSEGDYDKASKKDLIGRRKEKKDKKDRGYAALEGESSPEEELDVKSLSKSKKSKAFKFSASKSKEKREKSRDKEKSDKDVREDDKAKDKERPEKEKKKEKDKKEKDKKEKFREKEKDKRDKKSKQTSLSEDVLDLGDVQPVFGVSVSLATERSRCHDGVDLPLVIRDCIDYLQENSLHNEQIYKIEPVKARLVQLKHLYNNREKQDTDELDTAVACGLLKQFLRELPEPLLTTELVARFEEVASYPQVNKQEEELRQLLDQLPRCNRTLLSWILLHFDAVLQNEKSNKMNAQSLATLMGPPLQMSHRLLVTLMCHCTSLFGDIKLNRYVPPITSSSPKIPEQPEEIQIELRKQESLLSQIHSEMNAGFVSKKREEQLWEVQRIITQLKRKLRSFEKRLEKTVDESSVDPVASAYSATECPRKVSGVSNLTVSHMVTHSKHTSSEEDKPIAESATITEAKAEEVPELPSRLQDEHKSDKIVNNKLTTCDGDIAQMDVYVDEEIELLMLPKNHPDYKNLIRLQLENKELLAWKEHLQARISQERAEILRLKQLHQQQLLNNVNSLAAEEENTVDADYEKIIENYVRENTLLEHKRNLLAKEIFEERRELISLQIEFAMQKF